MSDTVQSDHLNANGVQHALDSNTRDVKRAKHGSAQDLREVQTVPGSPPWYNFDTNRIDISAIKYHILIRMNYPQYSPETDGMVPPFPCCLWLPTYNGNELQCALKLLEWVQTFVCPAQNPTVSSNMGVSDILAIIVRLMEDHCHSEDMRKTCNWILNNNVTEGAAVLFVSKCFLNIYLNKVRERIKACESELQGSEERKNTVKDQLCSRVEGLDTTYMREYVRLVLHNTRQNISSLKEIAGNKRTVKRFYGVLMAHVYVGCCNPRLPNVCGFDQHIIGLMRKSINSVGRSMFFMEMIRSGFTLIYPDEEVKNQKICKCVDILKRSSLSFDPLEGIRGVVNLLKNDCRPDVNQHVIAVVQLDLAFLCASKGCSDKYLEDIKHVRSMAKVYLQSFHSTSEVKIPDIVACFLSERGVKVWKNCITVIAFHWRLHGDWYGRIIREVAQEEAGKVVPE